MKMPAPIVREGKPVVVFRASVPGSPLWQRVQGRDTYGRALSDFMLWLPGLRDQPAHARRLAIEALQAAFAEFGEGVVFAELNLRLNLVWVTVQPEPGLCLEVSRAIRRRLPNARVIGSFLEVKQRPSRRLTAQFRRWLNRP